MPEGLIASKAQSGQGSFKEKERRVISPKNRQAFRQNHHNQLISCGFFGGSGEILLTSDTNDLQAMIAF
jgi:hypothetical protein